MQFKRVELPIELPRHAVECVREVAELVVAVDVNLVREIAGSDAFRARVERKQRCRLPTDRDLRQERGE